MVKESGTVLGRTSKIDELNGKNLSTSFLFCRGYFYKLGVSQ